jgi:hypothetical protein
VLRAGPSSRLPGYQREREGLVLAESDRRAGHGPEGVRFGEQHVAPAGERASEYVPSGMASSTWSPTMTIFSVMPYCANSWSSARRHLASARRYGIVCPKCLGRKSAGSVIMPCMRISVLTGRLSGKSPRSTCPTSGDELWRSYVLIFQMSQRRLVTILYPGVQRAAQSTSNSDNRAVNRGR